MALVYVSEMESTQAHKTEVRKDVSKLQSAHAHGHATPPYHPHGGEETRPGGDLRPSPSWMRYGRKRLTHPLSRLEILRHLEKKGVRGVGFARVFERHAIVERMRFSAGLRGKFLREFVTPHG